ncbi:MAG: hypothetical protein FWD76_01895 [Firmicutes bacterium]|nr:hypothetical protein [Bacillota bacterium]
MEIANIILTIISIIVTTILTIVAIMIPKRFAEKSDSTTRVQMFMQIREMINAADERKIKSGIDVALHINNKVYEFAHNVSKEVYLNVYDDACNYYLQNIIDKKLFEATYKKEICTIVETTPNPYFTNEEELHNKFPSLDNVYKLFVKN